MITVITGAAVAFFQSTRIERFVSRNYADLARAQLAAESGYALASALIRISSTNDNYLIVQNTNRQLFAGQGTNQTAPNTFAYLPLFSFTNNLTSYTTNSSNVVTTSNVPTTNVTGGITFTNTLPGGLTVTSPAVAWVVLTNSDGRTNARFAFWVEDLSGRLDLSVAGSTGTNATRPTGTNPAELALWSLFNSNAALDSNNAVVNSLTNVRGALVTPASARLVNSSAITVNHLADLAAGLIHDTNEPELVPYGFGYTNQGQPKLNLNQAVTSANALNLIAGQITNTLPNFTNRAGGMNGSAYVYALAANIIDYADANDTATTTNVNGVRIQGFDNYPYLTHLFDSIVYQSNNPTLTIVTYLQFWNLGSRTNGSNTVTFTYNFNDTIWYPTNTANPTNSIVTNRVTTAGFSTNLSLPSIPPNSGFIAAVTNVVNLTSLPDFPNPGWTNVNLNVPAIWALTPSDQATQTNSFTLAIGGVNLGNAIGFARVNRNFASGTPRAMGSVFGLRLWFANVLTNPVDPRMLPYLNAGNASSYDDSLGDSAIWRGFPGSTNANHSGNPDLWLEGKGSAFATSPATAISTTNLASLLGSFSNLPGSPPAFLSSSNVYFSAIELGRIFDPIQWRPATPTTNDFANLDITTAWQADNRYGGGATLRIGRPEHSRFTNNGTRAAQLLDLLAAGTRTTNGGATVLNSVAGRINLNTATTNTLRALAAGVLHTNDPALTAAGVSIGTNFVIPTNAITSFVFGITNFRASIPFSSPSQVTLITRGGQPVFGNSTNSTIVGSGNNPIAWSDTAAEEWFSKIYPLCTVRSRNFMIYVVAQAMTTNTNAPSRPVATSRNVFQVYAEPIRSTTTGLTTNVNVRALRAWSY